MVTKTFQVKREALNVSSKDHCQKCADHEASHITDAIRAWIKEKLPDLIEIKDGKAEFDIKAIVELKDGI